MRKWFILLILALLFNVTQAQSEEEYYTNNHDRYYHSNIDCDRPDFDQREIYTREIYAKYPVSEIAAAEFEKAPCPLCVLKIEANYLGTYIPEWDGEGEPWQLNTGAPDRSKNQEYLQESADTHDAFSSYYEEIWNPNTQDVERKHAYPACFAGVYYNVSGGYTYLIANPTDEILSSFTSAFGSGAWILPAKYGYDEIYESREYVFAYLTDWCNIHPELDARPVSAEGPGSENHAVIEIYGEDWQQAARAMETVSPVYIHFVRATELPSAADF